MSSDEDDLYGDLDAAAPGSFALSELTHERDALREENEELRAKMAAIEAEVRGGRVCERGRQAGGPAVHYDASSPALSHPCRPHTECPTSDYGC
jgi:hypothetical protein